MFIFLISLRFCSKFFSKLTISFSARFSTLSIFSEKLIVNFEKNSEQNLKEIEKINIYSKQIFDNVIREYDKFIK